MSGVLCKLPPRPNCGEGPQRVEFGLSGFGYNRPKAVGTLRVDGFVGVEKQMVRLRVLSANFGNSVRSCFLKVIL